MKTITFLMAFLWAIPLAFSQDLEPNTDSTASTTEATANTGTLEANTSMETQKVVWKFAHQGKQHTLTNQASTEPEDLKTLYTALTPNDTSDVVVTGKKVYLITNKELLYKKPEGIDLNQLKSLIEAKKLDAILLGIPNIVSQLPLIDSTEEYTVTHHLLPESQFLIDPNVQFNNNLGYINLKGKSIEMRIQKLNTKKDSSKYVGEDGEIICRKYQKLGFNKKNEITTTQKSQIQINDVSLGVQKGFITGIRVHTDSGIFRQRRNDPIACLDFQSYGKVRLYNSCNKYIEVGDVLNLDWHQGYGFIPDDTTIVLTNTTPKKLTQVYSLNSLVTLNIGTDLLALMESQDNGLVIVDLGFHFPLNRLNFLYKKGTDPGRLLLFDRVDVDFQYSRLDGSGQGVVTINDTMASPLPLLQGSDLSFRGNLAILSTAPISDRMGFSLSFFGGLNSTKIGDSTNQENNTSRFNMVALGFSLEPYLWRNKQFGIRFPIDFGWLIAYDDNRIGNFSEITSILRWGCQIDYFTRKDHSHGLFGKFQMVDDRNSETGEYYQFSIGYRLPLFTPKGKLNTNTNPSFPSGG